ncbi:MAG TPA: alpha-hydroxy-acid oxidizing protein [Spirochaetota bacterium]|nr:alpha-hydroxy-acid oxidizing protein [Spirochaetota bacterium]HPJ37272.1 alpha-hydroxy-acid oxidizing protein [Spirochaetota bacterium]HPQ52744.1 alpha-hydroxy-acid oxidizing protein [Spirochaetota bacterium]
MKKTIMVIGGGLLQVPVIQTAQRMGCQVIVTDYNPHVMGIKQADIPIIMSTRDIEGSVRAAKSQNEITPIHAVLTVGTDASMTVAAVASALGLPGIKFEDAEAATNKIKMRMRLVEHNVPCPGFLPVWSLADAKKACKILKFPVVIKPSDNMGARGVTRINDKTQIADAFHFAKGASPSGELIIEEFMEGPELSIDAVIYNGEITFTGVADRIIEYPPYFVETGHTMPSHLPEEMQQAACDVMARAIRALGITMGCAKGDIKITEAGPMIGECAARLSGGFMSAYTYPLSTGVDLMRAAVEVALGQEPGNLEPVMNRVCIERAIIPEPGIVRKIAGLEDALKIPGIKEIFLNVKPGDRIKVPRSNVEKAGNIIAVGDTLEEAELAVRRCKDILKIEVYRESEITIEAVHLAAREKLKRICYVCKNCDGKDCPTGVPGMGGTGTGASFRRNIEALRNYKINTRLIHDVTMPDTVTSFFGIKLALPVMAAPITGAVTNMGGAVDELDYNLAVVEGCLDAGTIAFVGDGATPDKYKIGIQAISEFEGMGVPIFKPRSDNEEIITRIRAAEKARAIAVGMDIDAVVFKTMAMKNQAVSPKSPEELKYLSSSTQIPFVLKGIMNVRDAILAVESGAHAIIISNHGGRVLDEMAGTMDVLEEIVDEVKGHVRIIIDGGFRTGVDILKALALGADYVLIGRPVAFAAIGMGARGVSFYLENLKRELGKAMILTGCRDIADITPDVVRKIHEKRGVLL